MYGKGRQNVVFDKDWELHNMTSTSDIVFTDDWEAFSLPSSSASHISFTRDWQECELPSSSVDPEDADGVRNANGWLCLVDGSQHLSASHSMTCKKFPHASRGNQAIACSVMAVAVSTLEPVCRWSMKELTEILVDGNLLYQDSFLQFRPRNTTLLNMQQILRKFYTPQNCVCRVTVFMPRQYGSLGDVNILTEAVRQFFREENTGVFVAHGGEFAVALFKNPRGFYMFNPGDCDRYGRALPSFMTGHGRACLSQYPAVKVLAEKLNENIPHRVLSISEALSKSTITTKDGYSSNASTVQFSESVTGDEDNVNGVGKFSIYGLQVTGLRKLLPYEQ